MDEQSITFAGLDQPRFEKYPGLQFCLHYFFTCGLVFVGVGGEDRGGLGWRENGKGWGEEGKEEEGGSSKFCVVAYPPS